MPSLVTHPIETPLGDALGLLGADDVLVGKRLERERPAGAIASAVCHVLILSLSTDERLAMSKQAVPIEHKTINTTLLAGVLGVALAALNGLEANSQLINWLPATWQAIILAMVPMLVTAVTGYLTPHTHRPDLAADAAYSVTAHGEPVTDDPTAGLA